MYRLYKKETIVIMQNRIDFLLGRINVLEDKNKKLNEMLEQADDSEIFHQRRIKRAYEVRDEMHKKAVEYRTQVDQQQQVIDALRYEISYLKSLNRKKD